MFDLQPPADEVTVLLASLRDDQLADPTPSPAMSVAGLITHLQGLAVAFRDAANKVEGPTTSTPPPDVQPPLDPDWRTALPQLLRELVAAWRDPSAWTGMTRAGGIEMPGEVTAAVASNELVIHGWDLAVATGQPFTAAPVQLAASFRFCSGTPDDPAARAGLFGPVVPVPDDSPLLDRTLGFAGRDPGWQPPARR